jgi:ubiquinone/menaquinone biosynthesis C-methylase UbiE
MRKVLNVGGNNKKIAIPKCFDGYEHLLLDIDPRGKPDILCDARKLNELEANQFDAVHCSHNLEHYYKHDVSKVLTGFKHVLKEDGFVDIWVPDLAALMKEVVERGLDVEDILYHSPAGPIAVLDMIYGHAGKIASCGNDFFAHKTGFTAKSLRTRLHQHGFQWVFLATGKREIRALAFTRKPSDYAMNLLNLIITD